MTWYSFDWSDFITDGVVDRMIAAAGAGSTDGVQARASIEPPLLNYLTSVGGLPVAETNYGTAARTSATLRLLGEGAAALLAHRRRRSSPGYIEIADNPKTYQAVRRIPLNRASTEQLDGLPGIGPSTARKIVTERQLGGPFKGAEDLANRVDGIGEETAADCAAAASFSLPYPASAVVVTGDVDDDLATLIGLYKASGEFDEPVEALVTALGAMAQYAATNPHPERQQMRLSRLLANEPGTELAIDSVSLLANSRYYYVLQELLANATQQIEVAMFHIALPSPTHPSMKLLDALTDAVTRGVNVRVLLDADRASDPYRSTVINTPAIDHLKSNGVDVRVDTEEKLFHSKFVLIDDELCIIGSHNWSAGSYFQHDDLTLAITASEVTAEQRERFDELWSEATPA